MGATIRDVAHRAGVSTATVPRIKSEASPSRPATGVGVRAAAEALDYRPLSIARSLKARTTLGLIVPDVHNPCFPELARAVEDAAWEHGRGSTGPAPGPSGRSVGERPPGDPARHRGRLQRRATAPGLDGTIVAVDPASAGWSYLDFAAYRLRPGQSADRPADDRERLVLVLEGRAAVRAGGHDFGVVGSRDTVFDGPPPPVILVAPGLPVEVAAETDALVVVAGAPAGPIRRTAYVPPDEILVEARGAGQTARRIHHLLPASAEAGRLIAFEVFTPGGNWSSYPPHKHDTEDPPTEARLEELYFYRFAKPRGFAFQRVYTPDRSLDEALAPGDGDVVLVPFGYHPVGAPAGYDCYYLNVMAGPNRAWHFTVDPDHAWLMNWDPAAPHAAAHEEASE